MNPVILERMRELQKKKENLKCSICCGDLTLKNIVNPECGHSTCKDCFWRWTKDKNTCPFCRTSILKNDQETKDIQHMRDLLHHRSDIVREVEESYEEHDELISTNNILKKKKETLKAYLDILERQRLDYIKKLDYLQRSTSGTYQTFRYFKEEHGKTRELYRIHRPFWRRCRQEHRDMFKIICKDINSLGRRMEKIYFENKHWTRITQGHILLEKIYRMNKIRKDRCDFRFVRDNNAGLALNLLKNLFEETHQSSVISEAEYNILNESGSNESAWNWQLLIDYNNSLQFEPSTQYHRAQTTTQPPRQPPRQSPRQSPRQPPRQPSPTRFHINNLIDNYQGDIQEIN